MTVRAAVLSLSLVMVSAAPAYAQSVTPTGSLTLMSRPAGAWFRLEGDVVVVGRTPMTLSRGLTGRFRVVGSDIGYQRWSRTLELDGVTADTVWITLKEKSAFLAGARSLIMPGWGQFYDEHPVRGIMFLLSGLAVGAGIGVNELRYHDRLDDIEAANAAILAAPTPGDAAGAIIARDNATKEANDARQLRKILIGVGAGVVGLSVIEAAISVPRPVGTVLLGAIPGGSHAGRRGPSADSPEFAVTFARLKF